MQRPVGAADPTCLKVNHSSKDFRLSSGGYEVQLLSQDACKQLCHEEKFDYAGLLLGMYCLCGNAIDDYEAVAIEDCNMPCSGDSDNYCGSNDLDLMLVIPVDVIGSVQSIILQVPTGTSFTEKEVEISIHVESTTAFLAQVDFGDGTTLSTQQQDATYKKQYVVPGKYQVRVSAVDVGNLNPPVFDEASIVVESEKSDFQLSCPFVMEPGFVDCSIMVYDGSLIEMKVKIEDEEKDYDIADPTVIAIGPAVPLNVDDQAKDVPTAEVQMPYMDVPKFGWLIGFEYYGIQVGTLDFLVLKPSCDSGEYCVEKQQCTTECFPFEYKECGDDMALCSYIGACVNSASLPSCSKVSKQQSNYVVRHEIPADILEGYQFLKVPDDAQFSVMPGDIFGFKVKDGAVLATRDSSRKDEEDDSSTKYHIRAIIIQPTNISLNREFTTVGNYSVSATMNDITKSVYLPIQIPITSFELSVKPKRIGVGEEVLYEITLDGGSDLTLLWNYGNGTLEENFFEGLAVGENMGKSITCNAPGDYVVSLNVSNLWNSTETFAEFSCYAPITTDWTLTSDSPQSTPPGKIKVTLTHGAAPLPTAAKYTIDYGDGFTEDPEDIDSLENPLNWNKVWTHLYAVNGTYTVFVNISNPIQHEVFSIMVVIFDKIGELSAIPYFVEDDISPAVKEELKGIAMTDVPLLSTVCFECSLTGYVVSYQMKVDDQEIAENSTSPLLIYKPKEVGEWTITLCGWNPVDGYSNNVTFLIRALDEVSDVEFNASTITPEVEEEVIFTIVLADFDSYTCFMFDGGDGSKKQAFGNKDTCTIYYNPNDFDFNGKKFLSRRKREVIQAEWDSPLTIRILHKYTYGGLFPASSDVFNSVSRKKPIISMEVSDGEYLSPLLWIDNNSTEINAPIQKQRGSNFRLETTAIFRDNSSYFVSKYWTLYKIDNKGNEEAEIDLSSLPTLNCSAIRIPKRFLEIGRYKLWYTLTVHPQSEEPHSKFDDEELDEVALGENYYNQYIKQQEQSKAMSNEPPAQTEEFRNYTTLGGRAVFTYLEIIPTPLLPMMISGGASLIVRGFGQKVTLEPETLTIDPDDLGQDQYEVNWFCRRYDTKETLTEISPPRMYEDGTPSGPILDRSQVGDQGGCFGKGPGLMQIGSGNYILKTDTLWNYDAVYEIISVISAAGKYAKISLLVDVIEKRPPSLLLGCEKTVSCNPIAKGQLVNPNYWLSVKAECVEDCGEEGDIHYSWTVYASDLETMDKKPIDTEGHIIAYGERLGINSTLYDAYPEDKVFLIEVIGKLANPDIPQGLASMFIKLNGAPEGGQCSIATTAGMALIHVFQFSFSGWKDPDNHAIEDYSLYVQSGNDQMHIEYGLKEKVSVILPYGELKIWCTVTDELGAQASQLIANFKTKLPSKEEFYSFEELSPFERYLAEGKMSMASQLILARNSVIEEYSNGTDKYGEISDTAINARWAEYLMLAGIDSSYYTPQAKEEIREELQDELDRQMDKDAKLKNKQLDKLLTISMDSLEDVEVFGGAMASAADNGPTNKDGQDKIMTIIRNMFRVINMTVSPSPLHEKIAYDVFGGTSDALAGDLADSMIGGKFVPSDMRQAVVELDYNSTEPNNFILCVSGDRKEVKEKIKNRAVGASKADQSDPARGMVQEIKDMVGSIQQKTMKDIIVGQAPFHVKAKNGFQMTVLKKPVSELSGAELQQGDSSVVLPDTCAILGTDECENEDLALGIQAIKWTQPLESYGSGAMNLSKDSNVMQIGVTNQGGDSEISVKNTTEPFIICISHQGGHDAEDPAFKYVEPKFKSNDDILVYHQLTIDSIGVVVHVELMPDNSSAPLIIIYKYGNQSALNDYDGMVQLKNLTTNNGIYKLVISSETFPEPGKTLYVAVGHLGNDADPNLVFGSEGKYNLTVANMTNNFSTNYKIKITTTGCYYFDEADEQWKLDGCKVASGNASLTCCSCNHLTSFASGFFTPPNTIDFSYVFANAGFNHNYTIYIILIVTFCLFIIIVIFAAWKDRKDLEKLGATPLPDNDVKDKYLYEIVIFTGHQRNAGTKSKVYFIASGEDDETEVRHLADDKRPVLHSGSIDSFVMAVPRCLGQLNYLRLWHDNSGKGKWSSWNVKYIVFRDVQTGHKFEFLIDRWFAVEEDDGMIDRLIPVAGKEQVTEFSHLFATHSRRNFADSHLWFSVFLRPPRSRFTRVQRVSCCIAVLYLSMLTNAMYYQRTTPQPNSGGFKFGPFSLTPEQIAVGLIANFIVFPPSFVMIFFFRKSRARKLRPSRIEEALKRQKEEWKKENSNVTVDSTRRNRSDEEAQLYHRKRKFSMPWWCVIFGWLFVFASIGVSVFFLWAYAISFGNEKTTKWLTSLLISFVSSVLITQPIKVVLMAIFIACVCRNVDDNDDVDEDEEDPRLENDEEYLHQNEISGKRIRKGGGYRPMDMEALEEARKEREKEVKMFSVMREIAAYFLFLWVIMILSYGTRDTSNFYLREALVNGFIKPGDLYLEFNNINTEVRFWNWTYNALIPELFAGNWYNGNPPLGLRLYLDDRNNFKIGYAVMRQIRSKPKSCTVHPVIEEITPECASYGQMVFEDGTLYTKHWKSVDSADTLAPNEYKYLSASQLKGYPFWGAIDWYGGGGYVVPLLATKPSEVTSLTRKLEILERDGWIDRHTRAIFIEIATYNAQVNLFCALTIVAEFVPGGGIIPYYHIDPVRLLNYHTGFGLFTMVIEIIFVIFTVFFTIREILNCAKQGFSYFTQYWNLAEVASILASYAMICIHVTMLFLTAEILRIFNETEGTGYVKLQESVLLNDIKVYLIGFVMSISTLKFLKLLRFNRRVGMLSSTLKLCAQELQSYSVCLLVVFTAFVILFWCLLGRTVREFSTFLSAFEACISMVLKKFDYESMYMANPILTPVAFFSFSLATALVLINILLSIIIRSFENVKHDEDLQSKEYEIWEYFINWLKMTLGCGNVKVRPQPSVFKKAELSKKKDTVSSLNDKVDRLADFINNFYFENQMDFNSMEFLKKMNSNANGKDTKGKTKKKAAPNKAVQSSQIPKSVRQSLDDF